MKSTLSVFAYSSPITFLSDWISSQKPFTSGLRKKLASHINCQPSFITQVLNGQKFLSSEQGYAMSDMVGLTSNEREYFLTLILRARAGTHALKKYYEEKIDKLKSESLNLKE